MTGLKKRFTSQGITLEQFAFQFVVILLGVYLAVVFEGKAGDRSRRGDADAMLVSVLSELALDEGDMEVVLEVQQTLARGYTTAGDLLATASPTDEAAIDSILTGVFNATVYPRRSAYTALLASGGLGYIAERDLSLLLVDLYEHHYVRLASLGGVLDDSMVQWFPLQAQFWDRANGRLIHAGANENMPLRNLFLQRSLYAGFHITRTQETLDQLRRVKGRLEAYLGL